MYFAGNDGLMITQTERVKKSLNCINFALFLKLCLHCNCLSKTFHNFCIICFLLNLFEQFVSVSVFTDTFLEILKISGACDRIINRILEKSNAILEKSNRITNQILEKSNTILIKSYKNYRKHLFDKSDNAFTKLSTIL